MQDFTLEPDALAPEPRRPVRMVTTGIAPTAAAPAQFRAPDAAPGYEACEACGGLVLHGETRAGLRLALDVDVPTYVVLWDNGTPLPRLDPSRGYPVHRCVSIPEGRL